MSPTFAQSGGSGVSNVRAKLNESKTKLIITYDLARGDKGYWDVNVVAFVDRVKIIPTIGSLKGDEGRLVKKGKNKRIIWDYRIDVPIITGDVEFEVNATPILIPPPPPKNIYYASGSGGIVVGLGMIMKSVSIRSKKGNINSDAIASSNPIEYYYTFCNPDSEHFNSNFVILDAANDKSPCDQFHEEAEKKYRKGAWWFLGGTLLSAAGVYMILGKPFYKKKLIAYNEEYDFAITPEINWQPYAGQYDIPQSTVGLKLTYQFGK